MSMPIAVKYRRDYNPIIREKGSFLWGSTTNSSDVYAYSQTHLESGEFVKINPETQDITFSRDEVFVIANTPFADDGGATSRLTVQAILLRNLDASLYDYVTTPPIASIPTLFKVL